ncbi:hypothetical protein BHE74_00048023 [Ensete ventricosum]|nr:hypothetical protein GW17_00049320 [Ensete ventricosum]RWW46057.1 hypothetical protein BHE74_00048023 [Ensete ventricosum]RZS26082.1 hypothetical protein BHM03_00059382 [Ensete ventricosum]
MPWVGTAAEANGGPKASSSTAREKRGAPELGWEKERFELELEMVEPGGGITAIPAPPPPSPPTTDSFAITRVTPKELITVLRCDDDLPTPSCSTFLLYE